MEEEEEERKGKLHYSGVNELVVDNNLRHLNKKTKKGEKSGVRWRELKGKRLRRMEKR